ncbi:hypothetical protein ES703_97227 [subsurface metagenome]
MRMNLILTTTTTEIDTMSAEQIIDHILDVMSEYSLRSGQTIDTLIWAIGDSAESEEVDSDSDEY